MHKPSSSLSRAPFHPVSPMTDALKKAFEAASRLSEPAQDELAAAILAEIQAAESFDAAIAGSGDALERLSDEASAEHRSGKTESLDKPA